MSESKRIYEHGVFAYTQKVIQAVKDGYTETRETVEDIPRTLGAMLTANLYKPTSSTVESKPASDTTTEGTQQSQPVEPVKQSKVKSKS